MANLQVRDMNDELYSTLRFTAQAEGRSISGQVITILQAYFSSMQCKVPNATDEFLKLCGKWEDSRSAEEICQEIRNSRVKEREVDFNGLFD